MASMKIRESFKCAYLQNYERNLRRMNSEKQRLLWREGGGGGDANTEAAEGEAGQGRGPPSAIALWGRDLLEVLSCFYCCYAFEGKRSPYFELIYQVDYDSKLKIESAE
ncbi:hypothetical protein EUGRSUZ_L01019 [Eucalyptus grandis]|uniref:Uncharacterized protein n=1 Tax=Eucalyptus grandis TaxID=71139 RepID=A0A058ZVB7_EUCGR|nr:hypothetical protein EUGRSUZ_L01019 [Eucalyptus grandis]